MNPLVENAADRTQVDDARKTQKQRAAESRAHWQDVLRTPAGRAVLEEILVKCKAFASVWDPSARIHYNAGQQDIGHWLISQLEAVDPLLFLQLQREKYDRLQREKMELKAARDKRKKSEPSDDGDDLSQGGL